MQDCGSFSSPQHQRPPLPAGLQGEILARWAVGSEQVKGKLRIQLKEETAKTGSC